METHLSYSTCNVRGDCHLEVGETPEAFPVALKSSVVALKSFAVAIRSLPRVPLQHCTQCYIQG